jgi:Ca-activated chloride channel homolog
MSFHWPHAFWLLLLPLGLLISELTRRARAANVRHPKMMRAEASPRGLTLAGQGSLSAAMPRVRWRLWVGLGLAITAFARPQWGEVEEPVFEQAREILIGVDLSKSMLAPDVTPTRLDRAKLLITSLLERLEGERVGLAVFAGTAFLQSPLSADYEILREFLPALDPTFLPEGGTEYAALIDTALDAFTNESNADRFLIVLSDGESQTDTWKSRLPELTERDIRVISLGVGTAEGAMLPDETGGFIKDERGAVVLSRLNASTLEELARRTSGVYRDASTWVDLADVLRQTVEAGRAGDFAESRTARRIERFQWALGPALLFLLWSVWREFPVRPRQRAVTVRATKSAATGIALLFSFLSAAPNRSAAVEEVPVPEPAAMMTEFEASLNSLITRLAQQQEVSATEFADLAEETITWGNQVLQTGQPPQVSVIYDALEAVDLGEVMDETAADWPTLREELEKLLDQSQQQQDQQNQDQEQDGDESQESEQEQSESESDGESGEGENDQEQEGESGESGEQEQDKGSEGQDGEQGENEEQSEGAEGEQSESEQSESEGSQPQEQEQPSEEERQNAQNAFDQNEEPESEPEPESAEAPEPEPNADPNAPQPGNQSIGGQQVQDQEAQGNPELVVPLQKLDQLKDQDSPAQLFQLMQDPNAQPPKSGRDW